MSNENDTRHIRCPWRHQQNRDKMWAVILHHVTKTSQKRKRKKCLRTFLNSNFFRTPTSFAQHCPHFSFLNRIFSESRWIMVTFFLTSFQGEGCFALFYLFIYFFFTKSHFLLFSFFFNTILKFMLKNKRLCCWYHDLESQGQAFNSQ